MQTNTDCSDTESGTQGEAPAKKPVQETVKETRTATYISDKLGVTRPTFYEYMKKYDAGEPAPSNNERRLNAYKFFEYLQEGDRTVEDVYEYFRSCDLDPEGVPAKTLDEIDEEERQKQSEWDRVNDRMYELGNYLAGCVIRWTGSPENMRAVAKRIVAIDKELVNPTDAYEQWEKEADRLVAAVQEGRSQDVLVAIAKRAQDAADRTTESESETYFRLENEHWNLSIDLAEDILGTEGAPEYLKATATSLDELKANLLALQESTPEEIRQGEEAWMYYYKETFFDKPAKRKAPGDAEPPVVKLPDPAVVSSSGRAMIMFPDVASEDVVVRVLADLGGTRKPIAEFRPVPGTRFVTVEGLVSGIMFYCEVADPSAGVSSNQVPFSL